MARVLLLPFGGGNVLAHAGSCVTIGHELLARGHEPILAYGGEAAEALAPGLRVEPADEVEPERLRAASLSALYRTAEELAGLVDADLDLLHRIEPDAAVVDARPPGRLACLLAGVPTVSVLHFLHWTRWRAREPLRSRLRRRARVRRAVAFVRSTLQHDPLGATAFADVWAQTLARLDLDPLLDPVDGDLVACTTTPNLTPSVALPRHWRYVGPVTWSARAGVVAPRRGLRPLVYVTQGSTGSAETLERVVRELRSEPADVLVGTAALCEPADLEGLAPNVRAARLLPGRACMEAADVAVVHGGHLTTIEAHLAGTPVVVVPHAFDQYVWANRVERLGTGLAVRAPGLPGAIRRAVRRILRNDRYRSAAEHVAAELRRWNGPANVVDLVEEVLGDRELAATARASG
jgi:UDP:flavonoid glycosyltransferase YjiC (YdhE family)